MQTLNGPSQQQLNAAIEKHRALGGDANNHLADLLAKYLRTEEQLRRFLQGTKLYQTEVTSPPEETVVESERN